MKVLALHVKLGVQSAPGSTPGFTPDLVYTPTTTNQFVSLVLAYVKRLWVTCGLFFY